MQVTIERIWDERSGEGERGPWHMTAMATSGGKVSWFNHPHPLPVRAGDTVTLNAPKESAYNGQVQYTVNGTGGITPAGVVAQAGATPPPTAAQRRVPTVGDVLSMQEAVYHRFKDKFTDQAALAALLNTYAIAYTNGKIVSTDDDDIPF